MFREIKVLKYGIGNNFIDCALRGKTGYSEQLKRVAASGQKSQYQADY